MQGKANRPPIIKGQVSKFIGPFTRSLMESHKRLKTTTMTESTLHAISQATYLLSR